MLNKIIKRLTRVALNEDGPTAVEYAVMLALIVATCVGAVGAMATAARESFDSSAQELESAF